MIHKKHAIHWRVFCAWWLDIMDQPASKVAYRIRTLVSYHVCYGCRLFRLALPIKLGLWHTACLPREGLHLVQDH